MSDATDVTGPSGADVPGLEVPVPNVLVGVTPEQTESVLTEAARLADRLGATLLCTSVDSSRYITDILPDGSVFSLPIDADQVESEQLEFSPDLASHIRSVLEQLPTSDGAERPIVFRALVGDPALALAALAESAQSTYVVVGSRKPGLRAGMKEFFSGSVAVHLVHRQSRPVLVVPTSPISQERPLPWDG